MRTAEALQRKAERERIRYQENREKKLEYQRRYYQAHREEVIKRVTECNRRRRIREIEQYWAKKKNGEQRETSRNQDSQ